MLTVNRQLPSSVASPFLNILMSELSFQSDGTFEVVQIRVKSRDQRKIHEDINAFFISADMQSSSGDFAFFSFFAASAISLAEGRSMLRFRKKMRTSGMSKGSFGVGSVVSL